MGRSVLASGELGQHNGLRWTIIVSTDLSAGDSQAGSDSAPRVGVRRRWPVLSHRPSARHPRSRRSHRPLPHRCNPKHPISTRLRHHLTAQPTPTQRPMPMQLIRHAVDDRHAHGLAAALALPEDFARDRFDRITGTHGNCPTAPSGGPHHGVAPTPPNRSVRGSSPTRPAARHAADPPPLKVRRSASRRSRTGRVGSDPDEVRRQAGVAQDRGLAKLAPIDRGHH